MRHPLRPLAALATLSLLTACPKQAQVDPQSAAPAFTYPDAPRGDVVDDYNGVQVADPYRWLEDPDSEPTRAWVQAENTVTQDYLGSIPQRGAIRDRIQALYNYERYSTPSKHGDRYFYQKNDGLQDQSVLYTTTSLDAQPTILIDPNTFSEDGTVSLAGTSVSEDGHTIAYGCSDGGSDWKTWRVRDIETGEDLPDELHWVKWSTPAWSHDGAGFFYSRYPQPENPLEQVNENHKVFWHALGTAQDDDLLVLEMPEHPRWGFDLQVSEDGRYLLVNQSEGTEPMNRLWAFPLGQSSEGTSPIAGDMLKIVDDYEAAYWYIGNQGDHFYFFTNLDAPRGKVIAIDLDQPGRDHWTEVIPQSDDAIEASSMIGGRLVVQYLHDAHTALRVFEADGTPAGELTLPGLGSAWGFSGDNSDPETFFAYSSFTSPTTIYRADISTLETSLFKRPDVDFDPALYTTEQVFYTSKDGTQVPMFIVHKKGLVPSGDEPVLLYGYGGFGISLSPWFNVRNLVWLEMGGVYAMPNLRGGGEYGEEWHQAGTLTHKQNVFDDFISAAQWLVDNGWTKPERIAIQGGSNGGLLVGATMAQRPDLFGAALPAVGVMDMLRYHLFTIGWAWASDYGKSDDKEMFPILYAYSPYHSLKAGTRYPSTLITTGDHDDRVVPAHSFKFAAELQHDHVGDNPVLIRIETRAGHGAGKSTTQRIDEYADQWSFLLRELHMTLPQDFGSPSTATE